MNAGNIVLPTMGLSLEVHCDHLYALKSKWEKDEQAEPSISTCKTIPVTTFMSNVIEKSKGITSDDELLDKIGSIIELIERYFYEQDKIKSSFMDGEVALEKFVNELTSLSVTDNEQITTLQSRFTDYRKFCNEEMTCQKLLYEKWNSILNRLHGLSSENIQIADVLEKMNEFTELFSNIKHELISLCENREALLDTISSHLSHIEESNLEDKVLIGIGVKNINSLINS